MGVAAPVHIAAQYDVREGVALRVHLPAAVDEGVAALRGGQGVHHHRKIAARRVLHADGHVDAARRQAVLLVFHRARPHRHIAEQIVEIAVILGIQQLIGADKAGLAHHAHVELADGDDALEHIGPVLGVRLVKHALIAHAGRARLVGVDPRHDENAVLDPLLYFAQAIEIVQHAVLPVGRAGADDQQQTVVLAAEDRLLLPQPLFVSARHLGCQRVELLDLLRDRELADKFQVHRLSSLLSVYSPLLYHDIQAEAIGFPRHGQNRLSKIGDLPKI